MGRKAKIDTPWIGEEIDGSRPMRRGSGTRRAPQFMFKVIPRFTPRDDQAESTIRSQCEQHRILHSTTTPMEFILPETSIQLAGKALSRNRIKNRR
jgi:hypothetical protein